MKLLYRNRPFYLDGIQRDERARLLADNVVAFRMRARRLDLAPHSAGLSLKTVFCGFEEYEFEERRVTVRPGEVLAVAPGPQYRSTIRTPGVTDSFSIFLPHRWLLQVADEASISTIVRMLNDGASSMTIASTRLAGALHALAESLGESPGQALAADEALLGLVDTAFQAVERTHAEAKCIQAAAPRTRFDLVRRVQQVREFLDTRIEKGAALSEIAQVACLSEFHILRVFRQVTGLTPSRYLEQQRMKHARALLREHPERPVSHVASACGYASPAAFGRAFRRTWGHAPSGLTPHRAKAGSRTDRLAQRSTSR